MQRELCFRPAEEKDVPLLTDLYDRAFLEDFQRYGQCPGYGRSQEQMRDSLRRVPKQILLFGGVPVGVLSYERRDDGSVYLGCLCIVPEMQGRGLGTRAFEHMLKNALKSTALSSLRLRIRRRILPLYPKMRMPHHGLWAGRQRHGRAAHFNTVNRCRLDNKTAILYNKRRRTLGGGRRCSRHPILVPWKEWNAFPWLETRIFAGI